MAPFIMSMCSGAVCRASILGTLMQVNIRWEMHPAQLFSLEMSVVDWSSYPTVLEEKITEEEDKLMCELIPHTKYTLCGLPIHVTEAMPEDWIRLMQGNKELARIENLAIPCIYSQHWTDFDQQLKKELAKKEALWREQQELS